MTTDIERGGIDVSGSHEPSYYEIALTNRQVVVAFVILLTCVVAAFFSGVWIGRESAARAQERLALLGRGNALDGGATGASGANNAADKGKPEGQALQEFKFFADPHHRPDAVAKPGTGAVGTTRSKGSREASAPPPIAAAGDEDDSPASASSASSAPSKSATPSASATPAPQAPDRRATGKGDSSPAGRSTLADDLGRRSGNAAARAATGAAPGAPAATTKRTRHDSATPASQAASAAGAGAGAASGASGDLVIQVFSTADRDQADRVRGGLVDAGFTAYLSPIAKGGQTMYRVRIGPFASRSSAETVAEKVRKERKLDTWITPK